MKNTFKYIAFGIALLASSFALNAQMGTYHEEGGMKTSKTVTGPVNGYYTISLESFATGETTVTESTAPVDIVLVLDYSSSMTGSYNSYAYDELASDGYSYNSFGNVTRYYLHEDGKYYAVTRHQSGGRNLRFTVNGTYYYLVGTGVTTTQPTNFGANDTIWTGVLYNRRTVSETTRIRALKDAVAAFVNQIAYNDTHNKDDSPREPVGNRIAVIRYSGQTAINNLLANESGAEDGGFLPVSPGTNAAAITNAVEAATTSTGTYTAAGLAAGVELIGNSFNNEDRADASRILVLFTDGSPSDSRDTAIGNAHTAKDSYGATVYSIGLVTDADATIQTYLNYISSNYPNATTMSNGGADGDPDAGYYQDATTMDLEDIFTSIAHASGAADAKAGASTQVRDVISNSFILPSDDAAGITIKVADVTSDGEDWEDPEDAEGVTYEIKTVTTSTGEEHKELMVTGFDYTAADTYDADGFTVTPGNWVGERYRTKTDKYWAGKKLIITFKIQANGEATGGDGTATNHPDSGVYVQQFNEDGTPKTNPDGSFVYSRVNQYDVPHTPLPLLIKIKKNGLRMGESATFQIFRARPKPKRDADGNPLYYAVDESGKPTTVETTTVTAYPIWMYNAIGKPVPDLHDFDAQVYDDQGKPKYNDDGTPKLLDPNDPMDQLEGIGWDDWSKVILTNKTGDKDYVEKDLYGLDPGWVYLVVEDDWGWSYELTGTASNQTTSEYEINPFTFHNKPRTVNLQGDPIVKHAEAVTINHFKTMEEGSTSREEHYKSSKTIFKSK